MKHFFTILFLCVFLVGGNAQLIHEDSFEESDGYNIIGSSITGSATWAGVINNSATFWFSLWSDANPRTISVEIVSDEHSGTQALLFDATTNNGNPRFRTDKTGYVNGDTIKITYWAKTDQAGVNLGGKLIGATKGVFSNKLTTEWKQFTDYGKIANERVQLWFLSSTESETYKVWLDDITIEYTDTLPVIPVDPEYETFPVTDGFEYDNMAVDDVIASYDGGAENDSWATTDPQLFDRFWRGQSTTSYSASISSDAYSGSKALKLNVTTLAGNDIRLRTVNIPNGFYKVTFYAKTDNDGVGKANIAVGIGEEVVYQNLTAEYAKYSGIVEVAINPNGSTRLIVFSTGDPLSTESLSYNVWIDEITIEEATNVRIEQVSTDKISIYPNPALNYFSLSDYRAVNGLTIYNISGQMVKKVDRAERRIDVSEMPDGVYIIELNCNDSKQILKFIKR